VPTPCDDGDVRWLCAHVLGGDRFAVLVLGGTSASDAMSQAVEMRHIGERPVDDLRAGADEMSAAFAVPGARQRTVSHLVGELTGDQILRLRIYDLLLHTWDLAKALGAPDDLDEVLVGRVLHDIDAGHIDAAPGATETAAASGSRRRTTWSS
jgi:uncharacterized protein (TIGR03086 family)